MDMNEKKAENTPAGGVLVGKKDGQTIIHDEGTMSGYLVGKLHKDGGIKAVNKATGQPLEMQGGEVVITAPAVSDQTKREFEGKMMTNREILSAINEKGGGVSFAEGGEVPERFTPSGASYNYGGKTMTDHEILNAMNGSGHLSKGKSLKQIAQMHNVSLTHINEELAKGLEVEKEHFADFKERTRVAKDHLVENPNYYTILAKAGLKMGGHIQRQELVEKSKKGDTPARDLNNYNDIMDLEADGAVGGDSGLAFAKGGLVTKDNLKNIEKEFLALTDNSHYKGIYDEDEIDYGVALEWGKYGYSVSEEQQSKDYQMLINASAKFNAKNIGKLYANAEFGDKYNTVTILDYDMLANDSQLVSRLPEKYFAKLKVGRGNNSNVVERLELEVKKSKDLEAVIAISKKIGVTEEKAKNIVYLLDSNKKQYERYKNIKTSRFDIVGSFNSANFPKKTFENAEQTLNYIQTDDFANSVYMSTGYGKPISEGNVTLYNSQVLKIKYNEDSRPYKPDGSTDWNNRGRTLDMYPYLAVNVSGKQDFMTSFKKGISDFVACYKYYVLGADNKKKIEEAEDLSELLKIVESGSYADGGITPYDANLDGDSLDVSENDFAKGGVVYDTTKPKIEKVTIKETKFNRASVVGRNASTVSELQQIVSDYIGTSPKEDYDWIKFYVNDVTQYGYYIDFNKGKKNTVRNVNPETLDSINFKRVIDAKTSLVRNYDWTDFFEGATNKTVRKGKSVDGVNVVYFDVDGKSKIFQYVGNSIQLYNFLRKLYNDGGRYAELQPSGNGILEYPKSIDINSRAWQNALFVEPEKQAIESIMNTLAFALFPKLDFSKFNNRYTPTASTSANKPFDLTNTKIWIDDNPELSKAIQEKAFELGWEWLSGKEVRATFRKALFFNYNKTIVGDNLSDTKIRFNERNTEFSEIFPSDLGIDVSNLGVASASSNALTSTKPLDLSNTKVWLGEDYKQNLDLIKKIQEKAFELGWGWGYKGADKVVKDIEAQGFYFDEYNVITYSSGISGRSFYELNNGKELTPEQILGIQTTTATTSAYKADKEVQSVLIKYGNGNEYTALNEESLLSMMQDIWDSNGKTVRTIQIQPQGRISSLSVFKIIDLVENPVNIEYEINPDKITLNELRDKLSKGKQWYDDLDWSDFFKNQNQTSDKEVSKVTLVYDTGTLKTLICNNGSELFFNLSLIEEEAEGGSLDVKVTLSGKYNNGQFFETQGITQEVGKGGFEPKQIYSYEDFEEFFKNLYRAFNFDNFFSGVTVSGSGATSAPQAPANTKTIVEKLYTANGDVFSNIEQVRYFLDNRTAFVDKVVFNVNSLNSQDVFRVELNDVNSDYYYNKSAGLEPKYRKLQDIFELNPAFENYDWEEFFSFASNTQTPTTNQEVNSIAVTDANGTVYYFENVYKLQAGLVKIWDLWRKEKTFVNLTLLNNATPLSQQVYLPLGKNDPNSSDLDEMSMIDFKYKIEELFPKFNLKYFFKTGREINVVSVDLMYDTGVNATYYTDLKSGQILFDALATIEGKIKDWKDIKITANFKDDDGNRDSIKEDMVVVKPRVTSGTQNEFCPTVASSSVNETPLELLKKFIEDNIFESYNLDFDRFFEAPAVSGATSSSSTRIEPYDVYRTVLIWKNNSGKEIIDSMDIFNGVSGSFFISRLKEIEEQSQGNDVEVIIRAFANDDNGNQIEKNDYFTIGQNWFKPSTRTNEEIKSVVEEWIDGLNFDKYFADVIPLAGNQNFNFKLDPNEVGLVTLTYKDKNGTDAQTFSYKGSDFITELEKIETDGQGVGIEVDVKVYSTDANGKTFNRNLYITVGGNNFRPIGKTPEVIKSSIGSWFQGLNFDKFFDTLVPFNINTSATISAQPFDFSDTKIWIGDNPELSRRVQEKAFESGWDWVDKTKKIQETDRTCLYFSGTNLYNILKSSNDRSDFDKSDSYREITEQDIFGNQSTTVQYKPINLSQTKIWIGDDIEVSKQVQERAFELGWSWKKEATPKSLYWGNKPALYFDRYNEISYGDDRKLFDSNRDFREITFKDLFEKIEPALSGQTPTVSGTSGSVQEINDLKQAVGVLEGIASQASQKYNTKKYEESLDLLKEVKEEYSLALSFTPESSFMYERIDLMKKIAEIQKEITRITELKNGGAYYILSKVVDRLERGENWKELGNGEIMVNEVPQQEIDTVIYTEKFKNWFGDWEQALITKEYDYVSKAITESGKPCVMYHGAKRIKFSYRQVSNGVVYLAENRSYAEWFSATDSPYQKQGDYLTQCFVNLKNPIDLTPFGVEEVDLRDIIQYIDALYPLAKIYDVLPPNTAMAIMNNQLIGRNFRAWYIIRQFPELNKHIRDNTTYDGFIYYENNPSDMIPSESGEMVENVTKATAVFNSNQVKLVDAMLFDSSLDDWRFETGGKVN